MNLIVLSLTILASAANALNEEAALKSRLLFNYDPSTKPTGKVTVKIEHIDPVKVGLCAENEVHTYYILHKVEAEEFLRW